MRQDWRGFVLIAIIAALSGWTLGRRDSEVVVGSDPASTLQASPAAHTVASTTDASRIAASRIATNVAAQCAPAPDAPAPTTASELVTALTSGTDSERQAALTKALQYDIEIPPDLLINAYVNDPSDDVRLLAFTTYIDSVSDDVEAARAALQSATNNTSSIVQAEAYRRLDDLARYEAGLAAAAAQGIP